MHLQKIYRTWWQAQQQDEPGSAELVPETRLSGAVVLAAALALFAELVMIRWHATSAHVFAIFKNISLLSCFLGLGIGYALSHRPRLVGLGTLLPLLTFQVVLFGAIASTIGGERVNPVAEQLVMGLHANKWSWLHAVGGNLFLLWIFIVNAVMFIPLGYLNGRLMSRLPSLRAYSLNLIGSLIGIGLFILLSLCWSPPIVWIGGTILLACPFLFLGRQNLRTACVCLVICFITLGAMGKINERVYYSPYQTIALRLPRAGDTGQTQSHIKVNHSFYQDVIDCSPAEIARFPQMKGVAAYYNLPARVHPRLGDVLVVGAGAGNDVAAALRNGASSVTAVEIDPAIHHLGRHIHPERPYQDPRTTVVVNDARTFIRQTDRRFDTIVYGLLDSHTNLGAMTNVRLDSFVYTVEAFQEAVSRLTDDGLLVVSYLLMDQSQADKLTAMLTAAYPAGTPRIFHSEKGNTFVTGPGLKSVPAVVPGVGEVTNQAQFQAVETDLATDDWPYFYMQKRTYPISYAVMIVLLLSASAWMVRKRVGKLHLGSYRNGALFFLGAGFMLVETKVITELGLTFGNTWTVSAVAITAILAMGFLANLWVSRRGAVRIGPAFVLLGATLIGGLVLAKSGVVLPASKILVPVILTAPLFFAGLIFSSLLSRGTAAEAMSANIFGAMLGGMLEYNSMYWGLSSLYPLGLALYGLAFACLIADGRAAAKRDTSESRTHAPLQAA